MSDPLRSFASTTTTAAERPLMIRLRLGKLNRWGGTDGPNSVMTAPRDLTSLINRRCSGGYTTSRPQPRTPTVPPRPSRPPLWAAPSTPRASPLTTVTPRLLRSDTSHSATAHAYGDPARAPTSATATEPRSGRAPATHNTSGGSGIWASRGGYRLSPNGTTKKPSSADRRRCRSDAR